MKKLLIGFAVLMLTSCIDVDDFGAYWDQTTIDPVLEGDWLRLPVSQHDAEHDFPAGQTWHFTLKDGAYQIQTHVDGKPDDEPFYPVKTLAVGSYQFLAGGPKKGSMGKYTIAGDTITLYGLDYDMAWGFIKKKHPDAKNFVKDKGKDAPVKIKLFDDAVYKVLADIPDDERYWSPAIILQRIKPADKE